MSVTSGAAGGSHHLELFSDS